MSGECTQGGISKVILWAVPRSISTAFFRAIMANGRSKVILEPFAKAYYYGSERLSKRYGDSPVETNSTFMDIKKYCEQDFKDCDSVFIKDMAYYLAGKLDTPALLPEGFMHTFLIRDPRRAIASLYKLSTKKEVTGWDHFDAAEAGFKELEELYNLVTKQLGQDAIVVDADDLIKYPDDVLKTYCKKTGLYYDPKMIDWRDSPLDMSVFDEWMPWFEGALTSTSFRSSGTGGRSPEPSELPDDVINCIDRCMLIYNRLYAKRTTPCTLRI
ncbi:unnamed protein product [Owenia fusiformis]|uniref:Sulfotransferase family protein n=1 Tax=Owenia fusiformis TaxID=6347 RepID=A0A8S4N3K9_OWEFU|nr:unnamed protein product [Owenia fusiformis]